MPDLLAGLGADLDSNMAIFIATAVWTFAIVNVFWIIGIFHKNHSIMDGYYGFGYAIPVWIAYLAVRPESATAAALLLMVSLHGCRLGSYLTKRWIGYRKAGTGDARYAGFYEKFQPGYWWKSFFAVMHPQTVTIIVIGLPSVWGVLTMQEANGSLGLLSYFGMMVFGIGYYFETVADGQLQAFKADSNNKGRYLRTGVWTNTRHPNYFGNTCVWWGIWIVAVSGNPDIWWTIAGPLFNSIMLTKILGKSFQDNFMGVRPEYQKLMAETNGFLPWPPKKK
jgi:steroid 5-alpha reductase family enzyme